jgi:CDP-glycerol glycerophosphotransferase (TagB/SpsB family)
VRQNYKNWTCLKLKKNNENKLKYFFWGKKQFSFITNQVMTPKFGKKKKFFTLPHLYLIPFKECSDGKNQNFDIVGTTDHFSVIDTF